MDIQSLWEQLTAIQFDPQRFVAEILDDCGLEGRDIRAFKYLIVGSKWNYENFKDVLWAFGR